MEKIILRHGHLIANEFVEAVDGAILINEQKIERVYHNTSDIKHYKQAKVIDLNNYYIFPKFIKLKDVNRNTFNSMKPTILDMNFVGEYVNKQFCLDDVFLNSPNLGIFGDNLLNYCLENEDIFIKVNLEEKIRPVIKKLIFKIFNFDQIILDVNNYDNIAYLSQELQIELSDILRFTSLNPARFLGIEHLFGTITKGKYAEFEVFDQNFKHIYRLEDLK